MNTKSAAPSRGRPREFDPDEVLDALVELFWAQGYEATSVSDIVAATGLNKSSLYNAFGSKEELFDRALTRYIEVRATMLGGVLTEGAAGLDDVLTLLDMMETELLSESGGRGCLAVNSSTELGYRPDAADTQAATGSYRAVIRAALTAAFTRAEEQGEIPSGSAQQYVATLLPWMLGISVAARGGSPRAELRAYLAAGRSLIESWRVG